MLAQLDGSYYPWLGDQIPPFTSPMGIDDATGTVLHNAPALGTGARK